MSSDTSRVVGLDIGGSKTHALAADLLHSDRQVQELMAGSANLSSDGVTEEEPGCSVGA